MPGNETKEDKELSSQAHKDLSRTFEGFSGTAL